MVFAIAAAALLAPPAAAAITLPPGFSDGHVASIASPTAIAFTPDGRMLVTAQTGLVRVVAGGALVAAPALDLSSRVCSNSDRGLLGVAVDPAFRTNRFVYLFYTHKNTATCPSRDATSPVNRISRFTLGASNTIDPASELVLVDNIPNYSHHNGGDLHFGKDGFLYATVGDGGCDYADANGCNTDNDAARDRSVLAGKVLRITATGGVPTGNPFTGTDTVSCAATGRSADRTKTCQEIYALGLRNPFRMAFDPNVGATRFYVNDVGLHAWDEIDAGLAGADYGWPVREGHCTADSTTVCPPAPPGFTDPIYDYSYWDGCRTITGGAFVPWGRWPSVYNGSYLFADYSCGKIFRLVPTVLGGYSRQDFATGLGAASATTLTFGPAGDRGSLYYTSYANGGEVRRIRFVGVQDPVLLAAGDISDCTTDADEATAAILDSEPGTVAVLGDAVYEAGTSQEFAECYDPTWGRHKARTRPAVGNHEYFTPGATGYYGYFGAAAGESGKGYYSYELGEWHVVVLNSECVPVGGCDAGSPQGRWLQADLAASEAACTVAYWHHPLFASGRHVPGIAAVRPFWEILHRHGADLILNGHDHLYERFAPRTPAGVPDSSHGLRQITAGTGGRSYYPVVERQANSEAVITDTFGVLRVVLRPGGYDWHFLPVEGETDTDAGSGSCHAAPPDSTLPTVRLTAPAAGSDVRGQVAIAAEASDDIAVDRVEFRVGGSLVAIDSTPPYESAWNSRSVADGTRTVTARAVDRSGNQSETSINLAVDNTTPETTVTAGPPALVGSSTATIQFSANESGASFECSLDGAPFAACSSPASYSGLADGVHSFTVRAFDRAGNRDETAATRAWTVDTTAPNTNLTDAPPRSTTSQSARFSFAATEGGSSFECSLDSRAWESCSSPLAVGSLTIGAHEFAVRAVDAAANADATPARWDWTVQAPPPRTTVIVGTPGRDLLFGTPGPDLISGRGGNDVIRAAAGDDVIYGGAGRDTLYGGAGNDDFLTRDGYRDSLFGGTGRDRARRDRVDRARSVEARF